jgi:hypothetical protein
MIVVNKGRQVTLIDHDHGNGADLPPVLWPTLMRAA